MRVRIIFSLHNKGAVTPFHHQHLLAEFVDEVMNYTGTRQSHADFVNFSGLKGQTQVTPAGLSFISNKVTLVLSSPEKTFIDQFLQSLFKYRIVRIGDLELTPDTVSLEQPPVFTDSNKYICISPLVLTSDRIIDIDSKRFISPETDAFSDLLYESTMSRMELSGSYTSEQIAGFYKFQLVPDKAYLEKIRLEEKKFARIYFASNGADRIEVRGYTFPFILFAAPEVHEFIFQAGLGEYTTKGFGMVDNAESGFKARITDYHFENTLPLTSNYTPREKVA